MALKELNTDDPRDAREYLTDLCLPYEERPVEWIRFHDTKVTVHFSSMRDTEAILAAKGMEDVFKSYVKKYKMMVN